MKKNNILTALSFLVALFISLVPVAISVNIATEPPQLTITMDKIHEVEVSVEKIAVDAAADYMSPDSVSFEEDDQVILMLTKIKEEPGEADFQRYVDYSFGETSTVGLVPGKYALEAHYYLDRNITIPGQTQEWCQGIGQQDFEQASATFATGAGAIVVGASVAQVMGAAGAAAGGGLAAAGGAAAGAISSLGSFAGIAAALGPVGVGALVVMGVITLATVLVDCLGTTKTIDIPPIPLGQPANLGGAIGNITVGAGYDLYEKNKLIFYVFTLPEQPRVIEDIGVLSLIREMSAEYPDRMQPR